MTVNSRFTNVSYITVYKTAGQRPDRSFHFSKYFLLGSTGKVVGGFSNGGCPFLPVCGYPHPLPWLWINLWITFHRKDRGCLCFRHTLTLKPCPIH